MVVVSGGIIMSSIEMEIISTGMELKMDNNVFRNLLGDIIIIINIAVVFILMDGVEEEEVGVREEEEEVILIIDHRQVADRII